MKKLSLLIALCMLVSIGGVYATWIYSEGAAHPNDEISVAFGMVDYLAQGAAGTYGYVSNSLDFQIDQTSATSYKPKMVWGPTAKVTLKFTPAANANQAAINDALACTITVSGTNLDTATFGGSPIFSLDNTSPIDLEPSDWGDPDVNGVYSYTLNATQISHMIRIRDDITLPTLTEYSSFKTAIAGVVSFNLVVTPDHILS